MLHFSITSLYTCILFINLNISCVVCATNPGEQLTCRKRHWEAILGQEEDTVKSFRKRVPAQEATKIREDEHADQRTQQKDTLFADRDDDAESDGQKQGPMVDKLQDTRKTSHSEPTDAVARPRSRKKQPSTMSNPQNGESSRHGQKRRSQEVSAGSMNKPPPSTQGALLRSWKGVLTEEAKRKARERWHRCRSSVLNMRMEF